MNDGRPSTREWAGKNWRRGRYGVVLPNGNGVTQNQRRHAQGKRIQVNGVPKETASRCVIRIATLNIRLGQAGVLEMALRALRQGNIGIRILQEKKISGGIHTQQSSITQYGRRRQIVDTGRVLPLSGGKRRGEV